ncbi:hypothetical protein GQ53DRAFT_760978 [Thozetella sp. PMI_491]|nr:hypothetical protein GQ53DRAFT_760978 [Thozetella sp. PMI_491]
MALSPAQPTPGIFWANSGVKPASVLPYSDFVRWYEEVHIPDWMGAKPGAITSAWRYQCTDESRTLPFLVVYKYPNVSDFSSPEFRNVPLTHPSLPGGGSILNYMDIQGMLGPTIEVWQTEKASEADIGKERAPILVSEAIDPADNTTDQFHAWYRETYIKEVSKIQGWRRTSRFENTMGGGGAAPQNSTNAKPKWLALHEFESSQTKTVEQTARKLDISLFKLVRVYGNKTAPWGSSWEDRIHKL